MSERVYGQARGGGKTAAPADAGEETEIHALLREYIDAGCGAARAEDAAGPHADTDPDSDRAWKRVADLRTRIGTYIVGLEDALAARAREAEGLRETLKHARLLLDELRAALDSSERKTEGLRELAGRVCEVDAVLLRDAAELYDAKQEAEDASTGQVRDAIWRGMQLRVIADWLDTVRAAETGGGEKNPPEGKAGRRVLMDIGAFEAAWTANPEATHAD